MSLFVDRDRRRVLQRAATRAATVSGIRFARLALLWLVCCSGRASGTPDRGTMPPSAVPVAAAPAAIGEKVALSKLDDGRRLFLAGEFAAARVAFEIASHHRRTRANALLGLAEAEFQLGAFATAKRHAAEAAAEGGGARAHVVLGNIRFKLRDHAGAVRSYEAALALDAGNGEARRNLGIARRMAHGRTR